MIHTGNLIVWRTHHLHPNRLLIFDRRQYHQAIIQGITETLRLHQAAVPGTRFGDILTVSGDDYEVRRVKNALSAVRNTLLENDIK